MGYAVFHLLFKLRRQESQIHCRVQEFSVAPGLLLRDYLILLLPAWARISYVILLQGPTDVRITRSKQLKCFPHPLPMLVPTNLCYRAALFSLHLLYLQASLLAITG